MNKKSLIAIVIIVGLGVGLGWSMLSNSHKDMSHEGYHHSDTEHSNHSGKMQVSDLFRSVLDQSLMGYFSMQQALSKDNLSDAKKSVSLMSSSINKPVELDGMAKKLWETEKPKLKSALNDIQNVKTIKEARVAFEKLSSSMEVLVVHFGGPKNHHIAKYHCPMVDGDRGASWLQNTDGTQNPYYGSQMFRCGSKVKEL